MRITQYFLALCVLLLLSIPFLASSQEGHNYNSDAGTLKLSVIVPDAIDGLSSSQLERLRIKVINLVTENNLSADGSDEGFVLYPFFQISDTQRIESTMKTLTQVNCTFGLYIKQVTPGVKSAPVFSSLIKDVSGGGFTLNEAITNAFQQIKPTDVKIQNFFTASKNKIAAYYAQNCEKIIRAAESATNTADFSQAFSLLTSIPPEAKTCYDALQKKIQDTYLKMQSKDCEAIIVKAKTYIAEKNYDSALEKLRLVDPQSVCKDDLMQTINDIASKVDADEQTKVQLLKDLFGNPEELEKSRLGNIFNWLKHKTHPEYHIENGNAGKDAVITADVPASKIDINFQDM